ncbi:MAG: hypothetical protein AB2L14_21220 [Candidatus Xenobiia bacterium LiM19]
MTKSRWKSGLRVLITLAFWGCLGFLIVLPILWMAFADTHWLLILLRFAPPLCYLAVFVLVSIAAMLFKVRYFLQGEYPYLMI